MGKYHVIFLISYCCCAFQVSGYDINVEDNKLLKLTKMFLA